MTKKVNFSRQTIADDLVVGHILRMMYESVPTPFPDCVISKMEKGRVFFRRPVIWGSGNVHIEEFSVSHETVVSGRFHTIVCADATTPHSIAHVGPAPSIAHVGLSPEEVVK